MSKTPDAMDSKVAPSTGERVVVAMSGGVDSSATAALLKDAGYEVVGMTMQLYESGVTSATSKTCCAGQDIYDAKRVADRLGIPHYVVNYESQFDKDVMVPFAESYLRGETPIPCVLCNQTVKFRDLITAAKGIGATALATGHYVRRVEGQNGAELHIASDPGRDQSYFLYATTKEQLAFLRFPLGDIPKSETRMVAERAGLAVADKPDSQDICFVPDGDYARVVERITGQVTRPGEILHVDGRSLGQHKGIEHFTVGQRRGLGIGGELEPLYVVRIEPETHRVIVGPKETLARQRIHLRNVNWLGEGQTPPVDGVSVHVRIRHAHKASPATIFGLQEDGTGAEAEVVFADPQFGVAPGQAAVFYEGSRVLGGGWIMRDEAAWAGAHVPHNLRHKLSGSLSTGRAFAAE